MRRTRISKLSRLRRLPKDDVDELGLNYKALAKLSRIYHSFEDGGWKIYQDQLPIFSHQPLGPDEIRLVDFGAGPGGPAVITVKLDQDTPEYVALSYCWGQDNCLHQFILSGQRLIVPSSLYLILRDLQSQGFRERLWADAICINQYDDDEKAVQIPLMGRIYSGADHVLGWIGEPTRMYPDFVQDLEDLHRSLVGCKPDLDVNRALQAWEAGVPGPNHRIWSVLADLMWSSWFRRVWILQEVMLATKAWIAYGPLLCSLEYLRNIAYALGAWDLSQITRLFVVSSHDHAAWEPVRTLGLARARFRSDGSIPIRHAMDFAMYRDVTKLGDKIYALYNILNYRDLLPVDLIAPAATVFARAAALAIGHEHDISLLSSVNSQPSLPGLPSWVPDLSSGIPRVYYMVQFDFSAGHTSKAWPIPAVSPESTILSIHGTAIDCVKNIVLPEDGAFELRREEPRQYKRACDFVEECLRVIDSSSLMHGSDAMEALSRVMVHDRPHRNSNRKERFKHADLASWEQVVSTYRAAAAGEYRNYGGSHYMSNAFAGSMWYRGFFVTEGGRFGIGPHWMNEGDTVLLLFGGPTPYLARKRPAGDMYEFIGEAYVDGIMYGEAMREFEESGRPTEVFQFD